MKGQLNEKDNLCVYRSTGWTLQICPFSLEPCGVQCPLFSETRFDCRPCLGPTYTFERGVYDEDK
jgi:hypothetical protein